MQNSVIGAQLFTLREFTKTPEDIAETLRRVREIGYEAVQVSGIGPIDPRELKQIADGEGLRIAATHCSWNRIREAPEILIEEHKILDCAYTAIGCLPEEYRNEAGYARFGREATEAARVLKEGGITFGYHNHGLEFERFGSKTGLEILFENSDPGLVTAEIDTYWVQFGGGDPAAWIRRFKGRMPLVHLKDMVAIGWEQTMAEVGEGNLNWPAILDACREAGAVWYLVEQDVCRKDPFESLRISLKNLRKMGLY